VLKILVAAIGQLKSGPEKLLAAEYETRISGLGRKAGISSLMLLDWPESRASDGKLRRTEEARHLWGAVPEGAPVIVMDERGEALSSAAFAKLLAQAAEKGAKQLSFLIGGPDGHTSETHSKALKIISFGSMTWPHRLVRVMLLEQIYRAVTILVNHPYHRA
jgi:23S rRNA (pseudouridine1915-N3)-methyltransferase